MEEDIVLLNHDDIRKLIHLVARENIVDSSYSELLNKLYDIAMMEDLS